jgi:two-component sensor histidine kinase
MTAIRNRFGKYFARGINMRVFPAGCVKFGNSAQGSPGRSPLPRLDAGRPRLSHRELPSGQEHRLMCEPNPPPPEEAANHLALALISSSVAPVMLLDAQLTVIAVSNSFRSAFNVEDADLAGKKLSAIGQGAWNLPQLVSLLRTTASDHADIEAYEMDFQQTGAAPRRLIVNAKKLRYSATSPIRLLLTVADVTDALIAEKLKDDLLREKAILLQELHHRVANSLQIIASVLLQSARRVQSDETRHHLTAAHQRVMSVAALQKRLSTASTGSVALRAYFNELCQSLGASMIRDHDQLSITVSADDSNTTADISVSLGLIVTELVINALKHAFPGERAGAITVAYASGPSGWTLAVGDNGAGVPPAAGNAKPGLGTSIVQALARQLDATISITPQHPGTLVTIRHLPGQSATDKQAAPVLARAI